MNVPFDAKQIADLEAMLGSIVPEDYRRFIDEVPAALLDLHYPGVPRRVVDHELYTDPAKVVERNAFVREAPVWGDDAEDEWLAHRLVIGMDLGGDVVFVDASSDDATVYRYLVESGRTIRMAESVAALAAAFIADPASVRRS